MVPAVKKYAETLIGQGVVTQAEYDEEAQRYDRVLEESLELGKAIDR